MAALCHHSHLAKHGSCLPPPPKQVCVSPCPQCLAGPQASRGTSTGELTHPKHKDRSTDQTIAQFKATSDSLVQAVTLLQGTLWSPITSIPRY